MIKLNNIVFKESIKLVYKDELINSIYFSNYLKILFFLNDLIE